MNNKEIDKLKVYAFEYIRQGSLDWEDKKHEEASEEKRQFIFEQVLRITDFISFIESKNDEL